MWEFAAAGESIDAWNTLLTIVERADAETPPDLDRLAQGILDTYTSHGGTILMARTMVDSSGSPFNYMIAAFDQPQSQRYELNFVKAALGPHHAYMLIHGVRVTDLGDYSSKAKAFLRQHSSEIGQELETMVLPDFNSLPRNEF